MIIHKLQQTTALNPAKHSIAPAAEQAFHPDVTPIHPPDKTRSQRPDAAPPSDPDSTLPQPPGVTTDPGSTLSLNPGATPDPGSILPEQSGVTPPPDPGSTLSLNLGATPNPGSTLSEQSSATPPPDPGNTLSQNPGATPDPGSTLPEQPGASPPPDPGSTLSQNPDAIPDLGRTLSQPPDTTPDNDNIMSQYLQGLSPAPSRQRPELTPIPDLRLSLGVRQTPSYPCHLTLVPPISPGKDSVDMNNIARKIDTITAKLETKDMELELLNVEMKAAYHTIEVLQQRVTELEQHSCGARGRHSAEVHPACPSPPPSPPSSCLLLGDTNLRRVLRSDLEDTCRVRTIPEANMDLLRSWVAERLVKAPSECVIYNGTYDLLEDQTPEIILDNLGALISDLKEKNVNMNIYVCQIVPSPMCEEMHAKMEEYNEHLLKWGKANGVSIIETVSSFSLGTGEVDDLCFDLKQDSNSLLNRLGVIKLMDIIRKQCPMFNMCSNWDHVKRNLNNINPENINTNNRSNNNIANINVSRPATHTPTTSSHTSYTSHTHHRTTRRGSYHARGIPGQQVPYHANTAPPEALRQPRDAHATCPATRLATATTTTTPVGRGQADAGWRGTGDGRGGSSAALGKQLTQLPHNAAHTPVFQVQHLNTAAFNHDQNKRNRNRSTLTNMNLVNMKTRQRWSRPHHTTPYIWQNTHESHTTPYHTKPYTWYNTHESHTTSEPVPYTRTHTKHTRGCYNCGEFNHHQATCRFDYKLTCGLCHQLGHKQKLCRQYSA